MIMEKYEYYFFIVDINSREIFSYANNFTRNNVI